jgi:hypothetical protein
VAHYGITPDIVTGGKGIAGGVPIGAYGLSRGLGELVEQNLGDEAGNKHGVALGGTLFGNALSLACAAVTLAELMTPAEHDREATPAVSASAAAPRTRPLVGVLGTWAFCLLVAEALCAGAVRLAAEWLGTIHLGGVLLASTEQFLSGPDVVLNFVPVLVAGGALGTLAAAAWVLVAQVAPRSGGQAEPARAVALRHT